MISTTVVLVGICNDNPMLQTYLGTFCRSIKTGLPVIFHILSDGIETCPVVVYRDRYTFEKWSNGHGLEIVKSDGIWRFYTGIHAYDSGSSGLLINGGNEMERLYRELLGLVGTPCSI